MHRLGFLLWIFCLVGCSPSTFQDLRCEGEAETEKLALELQAIETREDLQKALPRIRKRFLKLAHLLKEVRRFSNLPEMEPSRASEQLFIELSRLYELPGARELIESAEQEAIAFLSREP